MFINFTLQNQQKYKNLTRYNHMEEYNNNYI